jgi:hypothetical protein
MTCVAVETINVSGPTVWQTPAAERNSVCLTSHIICDVHEYVWARSELAEELRPISRSKFDQRINYSGNDMPAFAR